MSSVIVDEQGSEVIISINGRFDFNILQEFRDAYSSLESSSKAFVVDLGKTEYIDSSALGMLLNMKNHLGSDDQGIEIRNCQPNLKKIFSIAHFDKKFLFK
ncbi:STAS domain-containing protein [Bermanella marisrubri]|uniref:Anti-anti-sigma regulatory factor n=1 Tax=Bermanella marisrubri TaxID=207949 RepID=Q1N4F5_9GAMM|nr:STAS domain-containing protein [Bermanella marisrubri]EAT13153.1 Anti-anti-sigma regulatory factor [Oceanobacter sp. RED65] [Bermanella marisrubri]QIZ83927.1 STAS domain-containing protein [Bermanella marisrubri]